jgi:hypothetical protein
MKLLESNASTPIAEILNPRGNLAKELETTAKRGAWLSLMCGYWLAFHQDDAFAAMLEEPTYNLPKAYDLDGRFNQARKMCTAYETMTPLRGVHRPRWADRWDWPDVFNYWYSGRLDNHVAYLSDILPETNQQNIEKELLK